MTDNKEYHKQYRLNNKEKLKEARRKHYLLNSESLKQYQKDRRINDPERYIQTYLKRQCVERAKTQGLPCTISIDDIVIPEYCPILPWLKITPNQGGKHATHLSPTVDKIRPELGYIPGNIQVISHRANILKSNASYEELKALGEWCRNL